MCQKAHQFVLALYTVTATFPKHEICGLTAQMRRAAVSIPANIAEGFAKRGRPDKARFMNAAEGSLQQRRYDLVLARDLGYGETDELIALLDEVGRLINSYAASLTPNSQPLLPMQRPHRVDRRRAAGREVAGEHRHRGDAGCREEQRQAVARRDPEKLRLDEMR